MNRLPRVLKACVSVILLVALLWIGYGLRTRSSHTFLLTNTVSHFYRWSLYVHEHGHFPATDSLTFANVEYAADYPPLLAYATAGSYRLVSCLPGMNFNDFTAYFPVLMYGCLFLLGFWFIGRMYSYTAGLFFALFISVMDTSIRLSRVGYYTSENLGVVLLFVSVMFLLLAHQRRRFVALAILSATLLALTWQLFLVFHLIAACMLILALRDRARSVRYLLILTLPLLLGHVISVYLVGIAYSPIQAIRETVIGFGLQKTADYAVAFHRGDLSPLTLKGYLNNYSWLGVWFVFAGAIACLGRIREPKYHGLLVASLITILLGCKYQKYEALAFAFVAVLSAVGAGYVLGLMESRMPQTRSRRVVVGLVIGAVSCWLACLLAVNVSLQIIRARYERAQPRDVHFGLLYGRDQAIASLFEKAPKIDRASAARALIVPHHYTYAKQMIADLIDQAARSGAIRRVILLGPSHFPLAEGSIVTSRFNWQTGFGILSCDRAAVDALAGGGIARVSENPFEIEHSISTIVPFLKCRLPEATIVPVIVGKKATAQDLEKLAEAIAGLMDEGTLVVVSVDFSHQVDREKALAAETVSAGILEKLEVERLSEVVSDARNALYALLSALKRKGVSQAYNAGVSNSSDFGADAANTVGYIGFIYY